MEANMDYMGEPEGPHYGAGCLAVAVVLATLGLLAYLFT